MMSFLLFLAGIGAPAPAEPQRDWADALRIDAQALHDDIAANHPGPYNRDDPSFARRNDAGLTLALKRSELVRDNTGYWFAMRAYVASFNDGHLGFSTPGSNPPPPRRWPGFLTAYNGEGEQLVVVRHDEAAPPLGARLLECDGHSSDALAMSLVGEYYGRWMLHATRVGWGHLLFVDRGNPFTPLPQRCRFSFHGHEQKMTLQWREDKDDVLTDAMTAAGSAARRARRPIAARVLGDGTRWYDLSSFDGDPKSESGKALPPLIAAMAQGRSTLATAPAIVLDLRGNNGGSSDWAVRIAEILWGKYAATHAEDGVSEVDWRASPANIAALESGFKERRAVLSPEFAAWYQRSIAGMQAAKAQGEPLWRDISKHDPQPSPEASETPPVPLTGPVYVITDFGCASACLDALDLWKAMGAVHVGQETSADTLYMDIRFTSLPSGVAQLTVPMKVYKGRKRGSNVPVVPDHRYTGDLSDTPAVERWIGQLRNRGRKL